MIDSSNTDYQMLDAEEDAALEASAGTDDASALPPANRTRSSDGHTAVFKSMRRQIGLTQHQTADALCVSKKAVQSYEQGWRIIPDRVMREMITLVALKRQKSIRHRACWSLVQCRPAVRSRCPAQALSDGRFCWLVAYRTCKAEHLPEGSGGFRCLQCAVVQRLIDGPAAAEPDLAPAALTP